MFITDTRECIKIQNSEDCQFCCMFYYDLCTGEYPYAKCFICGEVGHLSRACPENPKGLYPHGNLCYMSVP